MNGSSGFFIFHKQSQKLGICQGWGIFRSSTADFNVTKTGTKFFQKNFSWRILGERKQIFSKFIFFNQDLIGIAYFCRFPASCFLAFLVNVFKWHLNTHLVIVPWNKTCINTVHIFQVLKQVYKKMYFVQKKIMQNETWILSSLHIRLNPHSIFSK